MFGDIAQGPESVVRQQGVAGVVRRAQRGRDVPVVSWVLRWGQLQCVCVKGCLSPLVVTTIIVLRRGNIIKIETHLGKGRYAAKLWVFVTH